MTGFPLQLRFCESTDAVKFEKHAFFLTARARHAWMQTVCYSASRVFLVDCS